MGKTDEARAALARVTAAHAALKAANLADEVAREAAREAADAAENAWRAHDGAAEDARNLIRGLLDIDPGVDIIIDDDGSDGFVYLGVRDADTRRISTLIVQAEEAGR